MVRFQKWGPLRYRSADIGYVGYVGYTIVVLSDPGDEMYVSTWERKEVVEYFGRTEKETPCVMNPLMRVTEGKNTVHFEGN